MTEIEYRRRQDSDVWHFMPDCQHYPDDPTKEGIVLLHRSGRPLNGELCNECQAKARKAAGRG